VFRVRLALFNYKILEIGDGGGKKPAFFACAFAWVYFWDYK
jgi:hypothetical protein